MDKEVLQRAILRVESLGKISDSPDFLQRTFLSKANRAAASCVMGWMDELGMEMAHDAGGTVRGVLAGKFPAAKALLIGSHLDTVIDAGKYDGALGIICAVAALEQLRTEAVELDYPVHVLGFSDEEGVRFQSTYLGSAGVVGGLDAGMLSVRDEEGMTLGKLLETEGWHEGAEIFSYDESSSSGYLELHIEQGRVLEDAGEAVAIVSGIAGQARVRIAVEGLADHAGTTPMDLRKDALAGAAEMILSVERIAKERSDLVGTVGMIKVRPGASNAIPQTADFTLDMRHPDDADLSDSLDFLRNEMEDICVGRGLAMKWEMVQINAAVPCDAGMIEALQESAERVTGKKRLMGSGAGHDGVMMSQVMPIGMIFVRCRAGLSHHPDEYAEPDDIASGIEDEAVIDAFRKSNPHGKAASVTEGMRQWFSSRPVEAELSAIRIAMELAGGTGAKLHVVHVTHPDCLALISEGKSSGVDVTAETCPHYLLLNAEHGALIGPNAKCAPSLRDEEAVAGMWESLDLVDTIGSDHSPSPPGMKSGDDVFAMWGGIAGCQHGVELVCDKAIARGVSLRDFASRWRANVFARFGVKGAGIEVGKDADFFILEKKPGKIAKAELLQRHPLSPYVGMEREWRVAGTWLRGRKVGDETRGRFLRPDA